MLTRSALTIRLHPDDDVVIAPSQLVGGTTLIDEKVTVAGLVPPGHKVATRAIAKGAPVKRYNQIIGFASRPISPGDHVHLHNLVMGTFDRDYAFGVDVRPLLSGQYRLTDAVDAFHAAADKNRSTKVQLVAS